MGFDYDKKVARIAELEDQMAQPSFWDQPDKAQLVVQELKTLRGVVDPLKQVISGCEDLSELWQMAGEDEGVIAEVDSELTKTRNRDMHCSHPMYGER